jgi:hypothetical protein
MGLLGIQNVTSTWYQQLACNMLTFDDFNLWQIATSIRLISSFFSRMVSY